VFAFRRFDREARGIVEIVEQAGKQVGVHGDVTRRLEDGERLGRRRNCGKLSGFLTKNGYPRQRARANAVRRRKFQE
jgi:hypothetical protein